jgi:hypothetical protein
MEMVAASVHTEFEAVAWSWTYDDPMASQAGADHRKLNFLETIPLNAQLTFHRESRAAHFIAFKLASIIVLLILDPFPHISVFPVPLFFLALLECIYIVWTNVSSHHQLEVAAGDPTIPVSLPIFGYVSLTDISSSVRVTRSRVKHSF